MRPFLAVAVAVLLVVIGVALGYQWRCGHEHRTDQAAIDAAVLAATTPLAEQLTRAERALATRAEVEHDQIVRAHLGLNGRYQPRTPYDSPARSGAESFSQGVS